MKKNNKKPKKAKASAKSSRAPKLENLSQTHGKAEDFEPSTLDQVWGDTGETKYGHLDEGRYGEELAAMTKSDIFSHASKVGIIPIDNREQLEKRLLKEFNRYVLAYKRPHHQDDPIRMDNISPEARKILEEGK